jgi:hypothetical protein
MASSTLGENRVIYDLDSNQITFGEDFMVYDHFMEKFGVLLGSTANFETLNFTRFETNFDIPVQKCETASGKYLHAVAIDEAISNVKYPGIQPTNAVDGNYCAAEYSFYRIEVDNSKAGGFHYKIANSNATVEGDVSWAAGDTVLSIKNQMTTGTLIGYVVTTNNPVQQAIHSTTGEAIGVHTGGYGNNTVTLSAIVDDSALLVDMSKYAVISDTLTVNDDYDSSLSVINNNFKNWRGVSCQTILGSTLIPIGPNTTCICNSGQNYSYYSGVHFIGFKNYVTSNGAAAYRTDGVNGTTNNSVGYCMRKAYFDEMMDSNNANYNAAMHEYYDNLLNSSETSWTELRNTYAEWYNYTPTTLYDVYIMSHMIKLNPNGGIVYNTMNRGKQITDVKGRVFTVTYNWKYVPAYPPEYNALHYGNVYDSSIDNKFVQGFYYHPETGDLGGFLMDSMMLKCNNTWNGVSTSLHNYRTALTNSTYLGCVGECYAYGTWYFYGNGRLLAYGGRNNSNFRCRPCSAYKIL